MQRIRDDLVALAAILADWSAPAPASTLFLFGSRVRGDHLPNSDVDVSIAWGGISEADLDWWSKNNEELFVTIDRLLPGKLQILEENDPVTHKVRRGRSSIGIATLSASHSRPSRRRFRSSPPTGGR